VNTIERLMRVMTHVNIGASLGLVAWLVWSGHQIVGSDWKIPREEPPGAHAPGSSNAVPAHSTRCLVPESPSDSTALQANAGPVLRPGAAGRAA